MLTYFAKKGVLYGPEGVGSETALDVFVQCHRELLETDVATYNPGQGRGITDKDPSVLVTC